MSDASQSTARRWLYLITIENDTGTKVRLGIVATSKTAAENEARRLANVGPDIDPDTFQKSEPVDSVLS